MNNQLPAYTPPLVTTTKSSSEPSWFSDAPREIPPNVEKTHRLVSQVFGRFLAGSLYAISLVGTLIGVVNIFSLGFIALLIAIGCAFLWFFFHNAYNEPEYLGGHPTISKFYPVLAGAAILFVSFGLMIGFNISALSTLLVVETFIVGCFYFMFMGNDFGSTWLLFCKPWRYRKLRPVHF